MGADSRGEIGGELFLHHARVAEMAKFIRMMRNVSTPPPFLAKLLVAAPMMLYGEARDLIYPKGN